MKAPVRNFVLAEIIVVAVLIVSIFTVILNEMLMSIALPKVMSDLSISATTAQWLTTGYMLTMAVIIPITGMLTERFHIRTTFTIAMGLFVAGTVIAAAAPDFGILLIGRVIQAAGTAIVTPLVYTAVNTLVPLPRRGSTMALVTIAISVALPVGPVVSGLILSIANWRWLFIASLPIASCCLAVGSCLIRVDSLPKPTRIDALSLLLSMIGFASLVFGIASLGEGHGRDVAITPWIPLVIGAAGVGLFTARQVRLQKTDSALLDLRPFSVRTFSISVVTMALFMTPSFGVGALLPVVIQKSYGLSAMEAGLFMAPSGVIMIIMSMIAGRAYPRLGPRTLIVTGATTNVTGLALLSMMGPTAPIWLPLTAYCVIVAGQALMWTPLFTVSLGALDSHLLPHGSAIANTIVQLAGATGVAVSFSIVAAVSAAHRGGGTTVAATLVQGAQSTYLAGTGLVAIAIVAAMCLPKRSTLASEAAVAN